MLPFELTVLHAFAGYTKGAAIWVQDEIKAILGSEHAHHVLKVPSGTHEAAAAAAKEAETVAADLAAKAKAEADALAAEAEAKAKAEAEALAARVAAEVKAQADAVVTKVAAKTGEPAKADVAKV